MSPAVPIQTSAILALLNRWFPDQEVTAERTESGTSTPVHRVTVGTDTYYLRPGEFPGDQRDAEVAVHDLLRESELPIPHVIRYEANPPEIDRSAALTTAVPGHPVDLETASTEVFRQAGRVLAQINAIPVQGYGWVDRMVDGTIIAEHPTRAAWTTGYQAAARRIVSADMLPAQFGQPLLDVIDAWATRSASDTSALIHGDFDQSHLFVTGAGYAQVFSGIIDFGEIRGADPLYDLGHAYLITEAPLRTQVLDGLLSGYQEVVNLPVDVMPELRMQAIAIATRWLANMLDRPPDWFRASLTTRLTELLETDREPP